MVADHLIAPAELLHRRVARRTGLRQIFDQLHRSGSFCVPSRFINHVGVNTVRGDDMSLVICMIEA